MNEYTRRYSTIRPVDRQRYNVCCPIFRRAINMKGTFIQVKSIKPVKCKNRIIPHYRVKNGVRACRKIKQGICTKSRCIDI